MKKSILNEINDIRRIMGLSLIVEGVKDELYALMKRLSSEATSETEKNEIKSILKRGGITDDEIELLYKGGKQTLETLSKKLEGNLTVELSDELEKILIKSGVAGEAFRQLGGGYGEKLIQGIESLYTAMKTNKITLQDYLKRKDSILDAYGVKFNRDEMERAIRSVEQSVDNKFESLSKVSSKNFIDDVNPDDIKVNNPNYESMDIPLNTPIEDPDGLLKQIFTEKALNRVKKEFKQATPQEIAKTYDAWQKGATTLNPDIAKKWSEVYAKIDKNWWQRLSNTKKLIFVLFAAYGPNIAYLISKVGINPNLFYLIPGGPWFAPTKEEQEQQEKTDRVSKYLKDLYNYRVLFLNDGKISDENVYLNDLITDFETIQNDLKSRIQTKIDTMVSTAEKIDTYSTYGMNQLGEDISKELNKILENIPETSKFKTQFIRERDPDYISDKKKFTRKLKSLKDLVIPSNNEDKYKWRESNKTGSTQRKTLPPGL